MLILFNTLCDEYVLRSSVGSWIRGTSGVRQADNGDPNLREFVEIPVNGPREVERAMMWLRRACRLGRTAAGPV